MESVQILKLTSIETQFNRALARGEFFVRYQPRLCMDTGTVRSIDTSVYWQHPQWGTLPLDRFLPAAEKTDFIFALHDWILETVCQQNRIWQDIGLPPASVSVTLFPKVLAEPSFGSRLLKILQKTALAPQWLCFEMSEPDVLRDAVRINDFLNRLHLSEIGLSVRDFRGDQLSLRDLYGLPLTGLKISRSLVNQERISPHDLALIATIIAVGRDVDIRVIAEGVNTVKEVKFWHRLHCGEIQGDRICPPLTAAKITRFLLFPKLPQEITSLTTIHSIAREVSDFNHV
jgi:EAL domain-containing protein (putative c-di-GMP-specific phosphodiesterase class I)